MNDRIFKQIKYLARCDFLRWSYCRGRCYVWQMSYDMSKNSRNLGSMLFWNGVALHLFTQQVAFIIIYFDALNGFYWPWTNLQLLRHISYILLWVANKISVISGHNNTLSQDELNFGHTFNDIYKERTININWWCWICLLCVMLWYILIFYV